MIIKSMFSYSSLDCNLDLSGPYHLTALADTHAPKIFSKVTLERKANTLKVNSNV